MSVAVKVKQCKISHETNYIVNYNRIIIIIIGYGCKIFSGGKELLYM